MTFLFSNAQPLVHSTWALKEGYFPSGSVLASCAGHRPLSPLLSLPFFLLKWKRTPHGFLSFDDSFPSLISASPRALRTHQNDRTRSWQENAPQTTWTRRHQIEEKMSPPGRYLQYLKAPPAYPKCPRVLASPLQADGTTSITHQFCWTLPIGHSEGIVIVFDGSCTLCDGGSDEIPSRRVLGIVSSFGRRDRCPSGEKPASMSCDVCVTSVDATRRSLGFRPPPDGSPCSVSKQLNELVDKLRERVLNAETQLKGVRAENQRLRQDKVFSRLSSFFIFKFLWSNQF